MKSFAAACTFLLSLSSANAWVSPSSASRMSTKLNAEKIEISKYEGLGNDFILVDARDAQDPPLTSEQSAKLCNRNFCVGGDGVIFALKVSLRFFLLPLITLCLRLYDTS